VKCHKFIRVDAAPHLLALADRVRAVWEAAAAKHGLAIRIGGFKPLIHFSFADDHAVRISYFTQEMLKRGFLACALFYPMYAHAFEQVERYGRAVDDVFARLAALVKASTVKNRLEGLPAASGFGRLN